MFKNSNENTERIIENIKILPILRSFDLLKDDEKRKIFFRKEFSSKDQPKPNSCQIKDKYLIINI